MNGVEETTAETAAETELETKPETKPEVEPEVEAAAEPEPSPRLRRRPRLVTVALVLAILLVGGATFAAWRSGQLGQQRDEAARDSLSAARAAATAIFSYDYKGFDAAVSNGKSFTTGAFTTEYAQTTATLKELALSEKAVVRAEVSAAGVVDVAPDQVEVLLYVNQYRTNVNIQGEKVDQNRVVLTMVRTPQGWKVLRAAAI
jgi:Mce-associated membrane protein